MMECYIVWNEDKTEGVVFTYKRDALIAAGKKATGVYSAIADTFQRYYSDQKLSVENIYISGKN